MLRIRYPSGLVVQYNDAQQVVMGATSWDLYADPPNNKKWIASLQPSAGAIVEYYRPCSVEQSIAPTSLRDLPHSTLRKMKRELEGYSIRNSAWKTG